MPEDDFPTQDPLFRLAEELRASRERLTGRPAEEVAAPSTPYVEIPPLADPVPEPIAVAPPAPIAQAEPMPEEDPFVILAGEFDRPFVSELPEIPEWTDGPEAVSEAAEVSEVAAPAAPEIASFEETTAPIRLEGEDGIWEEFPEFAPIEAVVPSESPEPVELQRFDVVVPQVEDFAPIDQVEEDLLDGPVPAPTAVAEAMAEEEAEPVRLEAEVEVPAQVSVSSPELEHVLADAAREVAWLARRVADGLELATAKIASFDERLDQLEALVAHAQADKDISSHRPLVAPNDPSDLEEWSMAIARLIRSDSHALREEFHRMSEEQGIAIAELQRLVEEVSAGARGSVDESLARVDVAVLRLGDSIDARIGSAVASIESTADHLRSEDQRSLMSAIDDRMEALARLVRSDNERLAAQLESEIEIGKQVLRAAKELQASLAQDVAMALDQRAIRGSETSAR